jgi:hypothetical protein
MASLDYFESQEYDKDEVQVLTSSGKEVKAIVYRFNNPDNLELG